MLLGDSADQVCVIQMASTQDFQTTLLGGLTLEILIMVKYVLEFGLCCRLKHVYHMVEGQLVPALQLWVTPLTLICHLLPMWKG